MGSDDIYFGVCFALSASKISLHAAAKPQDNTEKAGEATKTIKTGGETKKIKTSILFCSFLAEWLVRLRRTKPCVNNV